MKNETQKTTIVPATEAIPEQTARLVEKSLEKDTHNANRYCWLCYKDKRREWFYN